MQYEVSLDLLARMRREGVAPNLITYNSVLNACSKGALPWDQLLRVFALMREDGVQVSPCSDIRSCVTLIGVVLK